MTCPTGNDLCSIAQGDKISLPLKFVQPDTTPLNISGMVFDIIFKKNSTDVEIVLTKSVTFPVNSESIAGQGRLTLLPSDTNKLVLGETYFFILRINNGLDEVFTLGAGNVKVGPYGSNICSGFVFKTSCNTLVFKVGFVAMTIETKGDQGDQGKRGLPGRDSFIPGPRGNIGPDGKEGPQGIAGSGTGDFIGLLDTPLDYIGNTHQILRVNATANAVEFTNSIQAGSF